MGGGRTTRRFGHSLTPKMANTTPKQRFFNLTPHEVTIYDAAGKEVLVRFPSDGKFRLKSREQHDLPSVLISADIPRVPIVEGQKFVDVDDRDPGYAIWNEHFDSSFIVSLPMAQWL